MRSLLICIILLLPACSANTSFFTRKTSLEVRSMGLHKVLLNVDCSTIVCTPGFANEGDIWMTDIPLDQLIAGNVTNGQIIHLQVLWTPVAGKTPLASSSTNLTIKQIIIVDGEIGIYGGGGYCWSSGHPNKGMQLAIEGATIALQERSSGFNDLLTPATMTGYVTSKPDAIVARQIATAAARITP